MKKTLQTLRSQLYIYSNFHVWVHVCVYIWRSQRAISSCLLPQWYQRPLHPLSHVSYDKMVSISAALRTGTSKITQAAWKYPMGKANKDSIFSYDADCHSDRRQREGEVP